MMSELLVNALETCASMLLKPKSAYVVHHARQFAEISNNPKDLRESRYFFGAQKFLGMLTLTNIIVRSASSKLLRPTKGVVFEHSFWMTMQWKDFELGKRCRWLGFVAGALAYHEVGHFPSTDLIDARDMPIALRVAQDEQSPDHTVAHLILGYMQGWLWADGQASIDDLRVMNNPDAKHTEPAQ